MNKRRKGPKLRRYVLAKRRARLPLVSGLTAWAARGYHQRRLADAPALAPAPGRAQLSLWLLGVVLVACLALLRREQQPQPVLTPLLQLRLQPAARAVKPAEPAKGPGDQTVISSQERVVSDLSEDRPRPADAPVRSLTDSRALVMAEWTHAQAQEQGRATTSGEGGGNGATVFNPGLSRRLEQIPSRTPVPTEAAHLAPDAFGRQAVMMGDKCFMVQKLDDQAMRGMASWEPVDCRPGRRSSGEIRLEKLQLDQ